MTSARRLQPALDVLLVLLFAGIGRSSHEEGVTVGGVLETAGPFLVGLGLGWVLAGSRRLDATALRGGVVVWLATVVGGMVVRRLAGEGTAPSFVVVATLVLAAFLLGSRVVRARLVR